MAELGSFYDNAEEKENKDNAVKRQTVKSEKKELEEAIAMDISPDDEEDDSSSKTGVVQAPSTPPHVVSSAISSSSPSFTNETPSPPKRFKGEHETPRPAAGSAPVSMYNLAGKEGILEMETLVVSVSFTGEHQSSFKLPFFLASSDVDLILIGLPSVFLQLFSNSWRSASIHE